MILFLVGFAAMLAWFVKYLYNKCFGKEDESIYRKGYEEQWFGRGTSTGSSEIDATIHPFKIQVPDEVLSDLKNRIERTRYEESLEEVSFEYGFHSSYLYDVVNYWKNQYDWRKQEEQLNQYPHFKTQIEGIDVHFVHVKPNIPAGKNLKVIPLLLVHGWPGSFYEFYKMIPMLTTEKDNQNFVFEVICPSIPGYGFSESPHHKGFNQRAAARIFVTLMTRLGHSKFYIQGGDWGSLIVQLISKFYPNKLMGVHTNMFALRFNFFNIIKYTLAHYFPFLVTPQEYKVGFPFKKVVGTLLQETGYFHIQATKPDTVGTGLADSPVGLAAYILEKFSTWTDKENRQLPDGGLTKKFTLDELLTNVMIYWVNNNIKASQKFYKEYILDPDRDSYDRMPITVPLGVAFFPNELFLTPKMFISKKLIPNLVSFTYMPRGGHFAAFEEPRLIADDVWKFVKLTEERV
ncbi:epoxide hydrolase 1 [Parasteatoda tepidariorum]|uniref:epoxide hydrolase 1 n=1 Tax=Parasteatoda tepidariorum TaxID=114398 RepID=UPI00077FD200|nr:epoxide hydrolase 1 [Parasteatoda tepidariorum]XP_042906037.1 epoxide hydrolase 1 [Parasteatoda tepidariorum]XP_042906038.1 epoxide hydrolase 1 [Parasteatoda tepidariorum]